MDVTHGRRHFPLSGAARIAAAAGAAQIGSSVEVSGRVESLGGQQMKLVGLNDFATIGAIVRLANRGDTRAEAEITHFSGAHAYANPLDSLDRMPASAQVQLGLPARTRTLSVSEAWKGRIVDAVGHPIDGKGQLPPGPVRSSTRRRPSQSRWRLGSRVDLGVAAINLFASCCSGQRIGLFAGSGVGKSTLIGMIARSGDFDVIVVALIGERSREVKEFVEDQLGAEGLKRAVVVASNSDQTAILRREAAYTAMTIAEYFSATGARVLLLMDSITRFCHALREIALAGGEAPSARGFPTSVFAELPRLLERAGPNAMNLPETGSITAVFSVLVEGDDQTEPVADNVRGLLDGHVILDRQLAERGCYPAIDVVRSLSRCVAMANTEGENALVGLARRHLSVSAQMSHAVRLGEYRAGADREVDLALSVAPKIEALIQQTPGQSVSLTDTFDRMAELLSPATDGRVADGSRQSAPLRES